jgi:hypothetical protein
MEPSSSFGILLAGCMLFAPDSVRSTDYNFYFSQNIVKIRWVGHAAHMRDKNAYKVLS